MCPLELLSAQSSSWIISSCWSMDCLGKTFYFSFCLQRLCLHRAKRRTWVMAVGQLYGFGLDVSFEYRGRGAQSCNTLAWQSELANLYQSSMMNSNLKTASIAISRLHFLQRLTSLSAPTTLDLAQHFTWFVYTCYWSQSCWTLCWPLRSSTLQSRQGHL